MRKWFFILLFGLLNIFLVNFISSFDDAQMPQICGGDDYNCDTWEIKQYANYNINCYEYEEAHCYEPCEPVCGLIPTSTPACGVGYTEYTNCYAGNLGETCKPSEWCYMDYRPNCLGSTVAKATACK